jgi:hypothetical protein
VLPDSDGAAVFEDNDAGYLAWLAANPHGWVINIRRGLNPSDARLHRSRCRTINGEASRGGLWTGPYIKICATALADADAWALSYTGDRIARCGTCHTVL